MSTKNSVIYQQGLPQESLSAYIDHYDVIQGNKRIKKMVTAQTGMSLVFDFARNSLINTTNFRVPLLGLHDRKWSLDAIHATNDCLIIRLSPGGLSGLTGIPSNLLFNHIIDATEIFGHKINDLYARLTDMNTYHERIRCVEAFLLEQRQVHSGPDARILRLAKKISMNPYSFSFDTVKRDSSISFRQIERKFRTLIGTSIRKYLRISRFEKALSFMENKQFARLTDIGYEAGYFDQAHFSSEFKKLAGVSPKHYDSCYNI